MKYQFSSPHFNRSPEPSQSRMLTTRTSNKLQTLTVQDIQLDVGQLQQVYKFVDQVPSNRTKRNMNRDFSDGSYMADVIKFYLPPTHKKMFDAHNYVPTSTLYVKKSNWELLNKKAFSKLGSAAFLVGDDMIEALISARVGAIEMVLYQTKLAMEQFNSDPPQPIQLKREYFQDSKVAQQLGKPGKPNHNYIRENKVEVVKTGNTKENS